MRHRPLVITVAALVATVGPAACASGGDGTSAASPAGAAAARGAATAPADPAAELAAAAGRLSRQSMKVSMDMAGGLSMTGVSDPTARTAAMTMTVGAAGGSGDVQLRRIGDDMWVKFAGTMGVLDGAAGGKWMHIDTTALGTDSAFSMSGVDPDTATAMIKAAVDVRKTADHQFRGTLDLTRAKGVNSTIVDGLGDRARAVPFTATTDAQDRLVAMTADVSGIAPGTGTMTTTYSDFGTPVSVSAPPASEVRELPGELKGILDND